MASGEGNQLQPQNTLKDPNHRISRMTDQDSVCLDKLCQVGTGRQHPTRQSLARQPRLRQCSTHGSYLRYLVI